MKYYSIHGLFTIATNTEIPIPDYLEVEKPAKEPDMRVVCGPLRFKRPREKMMRTGYYYWKDKNALFIDYGMRDTKLVMRDLLGKPEVLCSKNFKKYSSQESWNDLINAIMLLNLIKRGYTLAHAGSLSHRGQEGIIISAPADTGKTSTILSLIAMKDFGFMSDDAALVGKGVVHAYPEKVKVSPYTLTGDLRVKKLKRKIFKSRMLGLASERILKMNLTDFYEVPRELVVKNSPIRKVFVFTGYGRKKSTKKISSKSAARMLFISSVDLARLMHRYMELYYYLFGVDTFEFTEKMNRIVEDSFKKAQCYLVSAPKIEDYARTIVETMRKSQST